MSKLKVKFGDWTAHVPDGISVVDRYEANFAKMNPTNLYQDEIGNDDIVNYLSHQILDVEQIIDIVKTTIDYSSDKKNKVLKDELLKLIENI